MGVMRRRGNVERELRVQLPEVGRRLAAIAREPLAFMDGQIGSAGVAALRWREAVGGLASSVLSAIPTGHLPHECVVPTVCGVLTAVAGGKFSTGTWPCGSSLRGKQQ